MFVEDWKGYIKNKRDSYKKMKPISCPAFDNEKIYFNRYGFDHIVYKDGIPRPQGEVVKRFKLLEYVPNILGKVQTLSSGEKRTRGNSTAYFWAIQHKVGNLISVRFIIRRLNNGHLHFFSIMLELHRTSQRRFCEILAINYSVESNLLRFP